MEQCHAVVKLRILEIYLSSQLSAFGSVSDWHCLQGIKRTRIIFTASSNKLAFNEIKNRCHSILI